MSSGLFSIARGALLAHQQVLATIAQNVANAETPGYSRQEAVLETNPSVRMPYGNVGTGVHVSTIQRKRDILLDDGYRAAAGQSGEAQTHSTALSQLEGIFGEPSDAGMSNALDEFWGAYNDLAATPSSIGAQALVQQRGQQVAQLFHNYDTQLTQQRTSSLERLTTTVTQINTLATRVADLNSRILTTESNGGPANDLRDQRDMVLDTLSKTAGTRVINQIDGTVSVIIGNSTLVDGNESRPLRVQLEIPNPLPAVTPSDISVRITLGNSPDRLAPLGGELKAITTVINTDIPSLRARLDKLASSLVSSVNATHSTGFVFSGTTIPGTAAGNFFDAGTLLNPVRGSTIQLDAVIAADVTKIAVSGNANAPTDNSVGLAISALRTTANTVTYTPPSGSVETGTFAGFFRSTVTGLGSAVKGAQDDATVYATMEEQGDARRQSVSGVNSDEELTQMLRVQQSYVAATKLIKTADEMLQTLLQLI